MDRKITTYCPYCGVDGFVMMMNEHGDTVLTICEHEDGGCGKKYVVEYEVFIKSAPYKIIKENQNG